MLFCSITNLIVLLLLGFFLSPVFIFLFAKLNCAQAIFYRFLLFSSRERKRKTEKNHLFGFISFLFKLLFIFFAQAIILVAFFFTVCCPFKLRDSLLFFVFKYAKAANFKHHFFSQTATEAIAYIQPTFQTKAKHLDARNDPEENFTHKRTHNDAFEKSAKIVLWLVVLRQMYKLNFNRCIEQCYKRDSRARLPIEPVPRLDPDYGTSDRDFLSTVF